MKYLMVIFFLFVTSPVFAQTDTVQSKWDIYLDHAYELTYWDEGELKTWIADQCEYRLCFVISNSLIGDQ